jgi:hypothetical protein
MRSVRPQRGSLRPGGVDDDAMVHIKSKNRHETKKHVARGARLTKEDRKKRHKTRIVLTGERQTGRHLVQIGRRDVWLRKRSFDSLCLLVKARLDTASGFAIIDKQVVFRLREAIDCALGCKNSGAEIIRTGSFNHEYRLGSALDVYCDRTFSELPSPHFVPQICQRIPRIETAGRHGATK